MNRAKYVGACMQGLVCVVLRGGAGKMFCCSWCMWRCPPSSLPPTTLSFLPQEAGMLAVRKNRYVILPKDFEKAYKNVVRKPTDSFEFYK